MTIEQQINELKRNIRWAEEETLDYQGQQYVNEMKYQLSSLIQKERTQSEPASFKKVS